MMNILITGLITLYACLVHPFYISMTDIYYNEKEKELQISVRIFTDDFENTLKKYHDAKVDILHPANKEQMDGFVKDYLQKHLQILVNDKRVEMHYIGYEEQNESIWTYFEVKGVNGVKKLNIENTILHDFNIAQANMIHVNVSGKEESIKLDYPAAKASFSFH